MIEVSVHHYHHIVDLDGPAGIGQRILSAVGELKELIIMNDAEQQAALNQLKASIGKIFTEVKDKLTSLNTTITSLQDALAQAGNSSPATDALFAEVKTLLDGVDGLIPDAPAPTPATPAA